MNFRSTLIAGTVAAMMAGSAWAQTAPAGTTGAPADTTPGAMPGAAPSTPGATPGTTPETTTGTPAGNGATPGATATTSDNPVFTRTADDLEGMDVVNSQGDKVGDIKEVVLSQDRTKAHAVIEAGGFLGIGARDVLVPLEELRPQGDDRLQMDTTKEQLKARGEYKSDQYVELEDKDQPMSVLVEGPATPPNGAARPGGMSAPDAGGTTGTPGTPAAPGAMGGTGGTSPGTGTGTPQAPAMPAR
jgi:sporulation protein YlmC with PRC-barrel domain